MTGDDMVLVHEFATTNSEAAFAALVDRHIGLVHSSALRQMRDEHLAQEVTQTVFIKFARKAASLGPGTVVSAWLYRATLYAAADARKAQRRRTSREQEAGMQAISHESEPDVWAQVAPLLDDALAGLDDDDRTALVLRYFEKKTAREIGAVLQTGEEAAQKRITRALEKLRGVFVQRGVTLTATAIAAAVTANAVQAAPAGLALTVKAASLAFSTTGTFTFLKLMTLSNLKLGISAIVVAGAAAAIVVQHQAQARLQSQNESLQQQLTRVQSDNATLSNQLAAPHPQAMSDAQMNELLKLRGEVGLLRKQAAEASNLRTENQQPRSALMNPPPAAPMSDTVAEQQKTTMIKVNNAKQCLLSMLIFQGDNNQTYPTNYESMLNSLSSTNLMNDLENNFDMVYQGSATNITANSETIVLREKQSWPTGDGRWGKVYGFADGHVEVHTLSNNSFDEYENQHIMPSTPGQ